MRRHAEPGITPEHRHAGDLGEVFFAAHAWVHELEQQRRAEPEQATEEHASTVLSSTWGWRVRAGRRRGEDDDVGLLGLAFEVGLGEALGDEVVGALGVFDVALQHGDLVALGLEARGRAASGLRGRP